MLALLKHYCLRKIYYFRIKIAIMIWNWQVKKGKRTHFRQLG